MSQFANEVLDNIKSVAQNAATLAQKVYDPPSAPLKAVLHPLISVNIPLANHTVNVIKGRAYLFGGLDSQNRLASNDIHIVILPSSGIESVDYKLIPATETSPPQRTGHSAAVIDSCIYIFGGSGADGTPLNENGRVWVFNTLRNAWSHLDPPSTEGAGVRIPAPRAGHASVASEHPRPSARRVQDDILPQHPPDPEVTMPAIPDAGTYGTLIVAGGHARSDGDGAEDLWTFDISTRTWAELHAPPGASKAMTGASVALVEQRLYLFAASAGEVKYLDLDPSAFDDVHGRGELGLAPLRPWQTLGISGSSDAAPQPGARTGTALIPISTGQGRNHLLLLGGKRRGDQTDGEVLEDMWTLELPPEDMSAASFTDAARMAVGKDEAEVRWEEVKYYDAEGVMIQESQVGRGIGVREGFAAAKIADVDGESALIWGGIGADGKVRDDGVMITIDV